MDKLNIQDSGSIGRSMHQFRVARISGSTEAAWESTGRRTGIGRGQDGRVVAPHARMPRKYLSFREFWPFYLREHSKPRTRALHYIGTSIVVGIAVIAVLTGRWLWLLAIPLAGYGFAWIAHFRVELNRPATFTYPLWSLAADFKMWWLWLTGRLQPELDKALGNDV